MQAVISPGTISGKITPPPSKSMMQRVCAAALLHHGKTIVHNTGNSDDERVAINIIQQLGARVQYTSDNSIELISEGVYPAAEQIHCGESGLSARLFIPIATLSNKTITINGEGSLLNRPFGIYADILPQLNVTVQHNSQHLPFRVQGPLQPADIKLDGSVSSQFLSGLLFALSYHLKQPVTIEVSDLKSKPYIELTLDVLKHFGKPVTHHRYQSFYIDPAAFEDKQEVMIHIEGDWSSAAALMVGAALAGDVIFTGLDKNSLQADKAILDVLNYTGAEVSFEEDNIRVQRSELRCFDFNAIDCPDLFPVLSVLAARCEGENRIRGVHRLIHKESNRVESICEMLEKFGVFFSVEDDSLYIEGRGSLDTTAIESFNDHRIVMAATVGALCAEGDVVIFDAAAVNKSYPGFFTDLQKLGAVCELNQ